MWTEWLEHNLAPCIQDNTSTLQEVSVLVPKTQSVTICTTSSHCRRQSFFADPQVVSSCSIPVMQNCPEFDLMLPCYQPSCWQSSYMHEDFEGLKFLTSVLSWSLKKVATAQYLGTQQAVTRLYSRSMLPDQAHKSQVSNSNKLQFRLVPGSCHSIKKLFVAHFRL